jgi:UDP-glucose 4-epimerase
MSGRPEACDSLLGSMEVDVSETIGTDWRPELSLDDGLRLALSAPAG